MSEDLFEAHIEPQARRIYTVSELTREIKGLLESRLPLVWVEGEISNLRTPTSGHSYFSLKDAQAQIRAVIFKYERELLPFRLEDGLNVVGLGRITVYEPRGEYQIVFETLEPKGYGALQFAFEQLKERLEKEGLFLNERKKPLPFLPQQVAVVTSPTGAAIRDFLKVLQRRYANVEVLIYPVRVQGEGAASEIEKALDWINRNLAVDVIVLTRGGGSLEDLWPFNEEEVARAIARSKIPVISAVGHEIDFTIADFVADLRAPTPSAAAEILVRPKEDLAALVDGLISTLIRRVSDGIRMGIERLRGLQRGLSDPRRYLIDQSLRVDELTGLLWLHWEQGMVKYRHKLQVLFEALQGRALLEEYSKLKERVAGQENMIRLLALRALDQRRHGLEHAVNTLNAVNPWRVLQRGYSITRTLPDLKVVVDAMQVHSNDRVQVALASGHLVCRVEESSPKLALNMPPAEPNEES